MQAKKKTRFKFESEFLFSGVEILKPGALSSRAVELAPPYRVSELHHLVHSRVLRPREANGLLYRESLEAGDGALYGRRRYELPGHLPVGMCNRLEVVDTI